MIYYIKALRICRRAGRKGIHTKAEQVCKDLDIAKRRAKELQQEHPVCTIEITDTNGKVLEKLPAMEGGTK